MKLLSADDLANPLLHHTVDALSGFCSLVHELVDSIVDDILHNLNTVVHSVYEWFLNLFKRRKEKSTCNNKHAIIAALITYPCISPKNNVFQNISYKIRNVYLLRPQSRGSDDDFSLIYLLNT